MSVSPPNHYKSRVFNAVSQQYRAFLDRCDKAYAPLRDRAGRQIRITASHATQILLYPFYVLLQGTRLIGKQLKAQTNIGIPQLNDTVKTQNSDANELIEEILHRLAPTTPQIKLQGIANRLDTQELVLVTSPNQTLYPLPPSQQKNIQKQIIKILKPASGKTPQLQPAIPAMGLILPVYCVLSQATGWVQASPIAVRMNLFGESTLAQVETISDINSAVIPSAHSTPQLIAESSPSSIQGLIKAAIHYFFNKPIAELNGIEEQYPSILTSAENAGAIAGDEKYYSILPQAEQKTPQPTSGIWQRMQHSSFPLFAGIGVGGFLVAASLGKYILEEETKISPVKLTNPNILTQHPPEGGLTKANVSGKIESNINAMQLEAARLQPAYSEIATDNIETTVTSVEYIKHPLEKLLEWLDGAIYWVEESFLKVQNWITAKIN
ncbi:MAG: hypothetical protein WBA13_18355 [Microcoleaceae cyanobacterium]